MKFSTEKLKQLWFSKWLFGSVIAVLAVGFGLLLGSGYSNLELKSYDMRFAIRGSLETESDDIAIVAIDDQSITSLKTWPLPRTYFGRVILNLYQAGAKLIVVDVLFSEASSSDGRQDLILAGAIKRAGNVILAGEVQRARRGRGNFVVSPYSLFLNAAENSWGTVQVDEDEDGFSRRYLLFQPVQDRLYHPLSLHAYNRLRGNPGDLRTLKEDVDGKFLMGRLEIPKVDYQSMLINFRGPARSFPTYSFEEILDDKNFKLPGLEDSDTFEIHKLAGTFKDKIVFIGASAEVLQDTKLAPFFQYQGTQRKLPGVEIHANALSTLLRGDFISRQGFTSLLIVLIFLSTGTMVVTKLLKPFRGLIAVVGILLFYLVVTIYFFINELMWLDLVTPIFTLALSYVGNMVHQVLTEQRERVRIKKSWEQYMSKDVIDSMLDSGDMPKFGGERRELSVLFSDIRGFTTFTEKHPPDEVVEKLSEYLTDMHDVVTRNQGTMDKYVGDAVMALFGAPVAYQEHAKKACYAAIEMIARLKEIQKKWAALKEDWFDIGIGINSGEMVVGNMGSQQLFDYTVIGDEVNLAARLEGATKQYGVTIIISEFTYELVKRDAKVRELDLVRVKGKNKPVKIYELRDMKSLPSIEQELVVDVYTDGLNHYKEGRWYQALKEFKRVLSYFPTDGPTRVYIKRCLDFMDAPPPENWDGVYEFTTK